MIKKIHFVGIGGSGISGVAKLAEKMGFSVTGCDLEESTAYAKNIFQGHDTSHIKEIDLVVVSPALFYSENPISEVEEAKKRNKLITWQEFLGKILLADKKLICIAGTHGKSTTTAMAGKLLIDNGFDPIVVVGANVPEWGGNSRFGKGKYAVVEADEFNNNFLNYHPDIAVINNIEFDHPDFFRSEKEIFESFDKFANGVVGERVLIVNWDDPSVQKLRLTRSNLVKVRPSQDRNGFSLKVLGKHNFANAAMVYALGKHLGIEHKSIKKSLEDFTGIGRRLELIADRGGVKVYDDYAHHPTAIAATLEAVRTEYPKAKILAIDEPHGYKRTKALLSNYKGVFDNADKVIIGPIFKARDEIDESITPEIVAKASDHKNSTGMNLFDEIIGNWKMENGKYNVVVVMGAGKSYLWAREIAKII